MKTEYKFIGVLALIFAISIITAFGIKEVSGKKSDMSAEMSDFSLEKNIDVLDCYYGDADYDLKDEKQLIKDELTNANENKIVIKAVPTGKTYANNGVIMQEADVKKVYKGGCDYKKVWIRNANAWIVISQNGKVKLVGQDYNLMEKDNEYMVFCNECKINKWSDKKILDLAENMNYGYFNLSKEYDNIVKDKKYMTGMEFYTDSKEVLAYYNKLKRTIISQYEK